MPDRQQTFPESSTDLSCPFCADEVSQLRFTKHNSGAGSLQTVPEWQCIKCGLEFLIVRPPQRKWRGANA